MGRVPATVITGFLGAGKEREVGDFAYNAISRLSSTRSAIISSNSSSFQPSWPRVGRPASGKQRSMHREPAAQQKSTLNQAGETIELQSPPDVGDPGTCAAVAEPWIGDQTLGIAARPCQCQTKRPGDRALRPTRI